MLLTYLHTSYTQKKSDPGDQPMLVWGLHQIRPSISAQFTRFHYESKYAEALPGCGDSPN